LISFFLNTLGSRLTQLFCLPFAFSFPPSKSLVVHKNKQVRYVFSSFYRAFVCRLRVWLMKLRFLFVGPAPERMAFLFYRLTRLPAEFVLSEFSMVLTSSVAVVAVAVAVVGLFCSLSLSLSPSPLPSSLPCCPCGPTYLVARLIRHDARARHPSFPDEQ